MCLSVSAFPRKGVGMLRLLANFVPGVVVIGAFRLTREGRPPGRSSVSKCREAGRKSLLSTLVAVGIDTTTLNAYRTLQWLALPRPIHYTLILPLSPPCLHDGEVTWGTERPHRRDCVQALSIASLLRIISSVFH